MKAATYILLFAVVLAGFTGTASAQAVISAKSGLINYTDGRVLLDGKQVEAKSGIFPRVGTNQELRTEDGRAEILLSPGDLETAVTAYSSNGVVLRIAENTTIKMQSDKLEDTRVELLRGSIIVECAEPAKDSAARLVYQNATISLLKNGIYRVDSEPARLQVLDGEARVEQGTLSQVVKQSRMLLLNGVAVAEKFDNKTGDAFTRWARRRAEMMASANFSAARGYVNQHRQSAWVLNSFLGYYTYVPYNGVYSNFWGCRYWSPRAVETVYNPPVPSRGGDWTGSNMGYGYSGASATSAGTSSVAATSAPTTSTSSSSTAVGHSSSGSSGGGRSR